MKHTQIRTQKTYDHFVQAYGRLPTYKELAALLDLTVGATRARCYVLGLKCAFLRPGDTKRGWQRKPRTKPVQMKLVLDVVPPYHDSYMTYTSWRNYGGYQNNDEGRHGA